jgi:hypothetical protein
MEKQSSYYVAFSTLATPTGSNKLIFHEKLSELNLVFGRFESQDFLEEFEGVCWELEAL